jgi:hypothetical protein
MFKFSPAGIDDKTLRFSSQQGTRINSLSEFPGFEELPTRCLELAEFTMGHYDHNKVVILGPINLLKSENFLMNLIIRYMTTT